MGAPGVEEEALSGGGLAGVDVGDQTDVAQLVDGGGLGGHGKVLFVIGFGILLLILDPEWEAFGVFFIVAYVISASAVIGGALPHHDNTEKPLASSCQRTKSLPLGLQQSLKEL
jgi:hypothetical protein